MDRAADQLADRMQEEKSRQQIQMERMIGGEVRKYESQQDLNYERSKDSKLFAGLMSLDEIKAKKARIESGEEFEGPAAKAARMKRADALLAAREQMAREARLAAKKDKEKNASTNSISETSEKAQHGGSSGTGEKSKERKSGKRGAVLSFDPEDE